MHVLKVHNFYQQPGGEDQSFAAEIALLERYGHRVTRYTIHNDTINGMRRLSLASKTIWNNVVYRELRTLIRREQPDLVHFENTFPLISPAAYYAARHEGLPVVQSLRNYRLFCANGSFLRAGHVCEDCLNKAIPLPALINCCYRNSRTATAVVVALQVTHRVIGTWQRAVDCFIALTEFGRRTFITGGLPADKILVKPNFVAVDPGRGPGAGGYALFVGRLSEEKGIARMLAAWKRVGTRMPLKIVGDGPLGPQVAAATVTQPAIEWLGRRSPAQVTEIMQNATVLIFPSIWYEGFPRVIVEAYAAGLPVISSNLGSMTELIMHRRTGLLVATDDDSDLATQVLWAVDHPDELAAMRVFARAAFEASYTPEQNYVQMMQIYTNCIKQRMLV